MGGDHIGMNSSQYLVLVIDITRLWGGIRACPGMNSSQYLVIEITTRLWGGMS